MAPPKVYLKELPMCKSSTQISAGPSRRHCSTVLHIFVAVIVQGPKTGCWHAPPKVNRSGKGTCSRVLREGWCLERWGCLSPPMAGEWLHPTLRRGYRRWRLWDIWLVVSSGRPGSLHLVEVVGGRRRPGSGRR